MRSWMLLCKARLINVRGPDSGTIMPALSQYCPGVQGDALSADEAIKLMAACSDSKGRVWYQNYAMELQ